MAKYTAKITLIAALAAVPLGLVVTLTPAEAAVPGATKVLIVMEENHSMTQMQTGMPYTFGLAQTYGYATRWAAIRHPSLPNYVALGSGQTYSITDDKPPSAHVLRGKSIFGQAVAAGKTAKSYNEGMTSNCKTGNTGQYRVKHNPWAYFADERTACLAGDVATGTLTSGPLLTDITNGTLPNVGMITPDLTHDAHSGTLAVADTWFKGWMQKVFAGPDWKSGNLVVILTADESDGGSANNVLTVVIHPSQSHNVATTALGHYSLTRFCEDVVGAPYLAGAATAPSMTTAFGIH
jgi:phosphatidylinositol-3-phosphatase